jgi:hypothetical protein
MDDWVRFSAGSRDFTLFHSIQIGFGVQGVSYPIGSGGYFPGVKLTGSEANHSPPSCAEVDNVETIPPFPHKIHGVMLN